MTSRKTRSPTDTGHRPEMKARGFRYWTSKRDGEVALRQEDAFTSQPPVTVHDMVMNTAIKYANCIALGSKHRNGWHLLTYVEYYEECRRAAKAFLKLGLERFHSVGIMGLNSQEWVIASIGAIMAGGFSVGILSTNSPKACQVIAESSEIDIFVVDNDRQLQKVIQIQGYLKHLKAIVQYKEEIRTRLQNLYSWRGFLDLADGISEDTLDRVIDSQKPNQCCTLVYSLSVTGPPKAMMLSHDNITWTTVATAQSLSYKCPPEEQEVLVSYLPLSYMSAQLFDMWISIFVAGALYFAQPDALRGSLVDTLQEVKPTTFHGVPWVWDRLLDSLKTNQLASSPFRRRIDKWAMWLGLRTNKRRILGQLHPPLCFSLAKKLTFNQARKSLGLHHCRQFFNLGLGLPRATMDYFLSLNMPIFELYGLSESTGIHTLSRQQDFRLLSCGKSLPSTHTKMQREDEEGIGDIHIWGRNVFMGYLNDEENTQEKIDVHGWLHTGDLGFLDTDEFLYIMGNARDIITLSSGERINPNPIEARVKRHIPIVRYVVVVGQDAPYLCALLTLKCQVNMDTGEPRNALTSEAVAFCRHLRSQATRLSDIVYDGDPVVLEFISQGIDAANAEVSSDSAKIVKWTILETDFSVAGGELGATTKLKRAMVAKIYQTEIERFYKEDEES
ncbi:long-chain-fatty-acid--CoA ligase ACSBG2-like isoform X1 [Canis lupus familiaris]|uniref:long-chain-fatty-acid--CoA ligase n=3 Tax=Canis lupus TaxID=9612 RepID=A0A8C0TUD2_CANLF|nr:long-chain-fatty-acid--CoA ligase ACSBG2-like isoform X1 [Canis lupus dingo]XP_025312970.1 long-chain-fatty-acid--CoA ligase ACSBG2-like isoform X1 [Canis lupus dingo]XP_038284856.1 long-chain-fatty-acid--CoA ligase ACSBG2-like isoform X1 [Canis lupus familiaris]XP_038284857.1 long-chain-fatty-acid--CoA ligase ACSBG2-like isoform X1 [Canis lupus familiaris]XP_038311003.1 long-chain-fatty-acid--CoA ligase ACSBG2-like isoform X1 [Canis lupus familiaris]XP_038311004.1 long-chain-fatty-acid--Co